MSEQAVHAANQMYRCRKSLRSLFKNEFFEKIKPFQKIIEAEKTRSNSDTINATVTILTQNQVDEVTTIWILATCVEMMEPTKPEDR